MRSTDRGCLAFYTPKVHPSLYQPPFGTPPAADVVSFLRCRGTTREETRPNGNGSRPDSIGRLPPTFPGGVVITPLCTPPGSFFLLHRRSQASGALLPGPLRMIQIGLRPSPCGARRPYPHRVARTLDPV